MAPRSFEEVWKLLHQLEGKTIPTLINKRRNLILCVLPTKIVRQTERTDGSGWKEATAVQRTTFQRM